MKVKIPSDAWSDMSPDDFEELVYWILHREGLFNVSWHGLSGSDKGRDIIGERRDLFGSRSIVQKCIVQCKRYTGAVARSVLQNDLAKAVEHKPDIFVLATTGVLSSSAKDWIKATESMFLFRFVLWERLDLEVILERHQDLALQYLGVEPYPEYFLGEITHGLSLPELRRMFMKPSVLSILHNACRLAIESSGFLTSAHLIASLLQMDTVCTIPTIQKLGWDEISIRKCLEPALSPETKPNRDYRNSLRHTTAFKQIMAAAVGLSKRMPRDLMEERDLCLACLISASASSTIKDLDSISEFSSSKMLAYLIEQIFSESERDIIGHFMVEVGCLESVPLKPPTSLDTSETRKHTELRKINPSITIGMADEVASLARRKNRWRPKKPEKPVGEAKKSAGGEHLYIEVVYGPQDGLRKSFDASVVTIGRSNDADLSLPADTGLSRLHARVFRPDSESFVLEDLGSTNGTYYDGERLTEPVAIEPGSSFSVGHVEIQICESSGEVPVEDSESVTDKELSSASKQLLEAAFRCTAGNDYLGVEHLFLGFFEMLNRTSINATASGGLDIAAIVDQVREWIGDESCSFTPRFERIAKIAEGLADESSSETVDPSHFMQAALSDGGVVREVLEDLETDINALKAVIFS